MPLSENERRDLKGLEQQLKTENPKLAAALSTRSSSGWFSTPHPAAGTSAVVVGAVLLIVSLVTTTTALALAGLLTLSAGITLLAARKLGTGHQVWASVNGFIRKRKNPK